MSTYRLAELEADLKKQPKDIYTDSRMVKPGSIYIALSEKSSDRASFIIDAVSQGAASVVCCSEDEKFCGTAKAILVKDPRQALGRLAQIIYGTESLSFPVIGVTGTNGKTTITYLLDYIFTMHSKKTGVLGTIAYRWPGHFENASLTTPSCLDLHRILGKMDSGGVDIGFMEVSSHALDQQRVAGICFSGAIFTNLTQDHLDYHSNMEDYFFAKAKLFLEYPHKDKFMAISTDNSWGEKLAQLLSNPVCFGLKIQKNRTRYLSGTILSSTSKGLQLKMSFEGEHWEMASPLIGAHNAENLLATQALSLQLGIQPKAFSAFESFPGVPGRLERITNNQGLDIFVDYAHTPDALYNVLASLKSLGFKRVITVFGCGGDRDRAKRPLMGKAVSKFSDVVIVTSDNPRTEDPDAIISEVLPGLNSVKKVITDSDREHAIEKAVNILGSGDVLLVAGKGHEATQQIGHEKYPFSDQAVIRKILGCM